jgi:hypothetical protein
MGIANGHGVAGVTTLDDTGTFFAAAAAAADSLGLDIDTKCTTP